MSSSNSDKNVLKGNFAPKKEVFAPAESTTLEDQFEREALKRLGGSVAFVAKRKVVWDLNTVEEADKAEKEKKKQ